MKFNDNGFGPVYSEYTMRDFPRHSMGVYNNLEEQTALLRDYILSARQRGNRVAIFYHDEDQEPLLTRLSTLELNLTQGILDGWLICDVASGIYAPSGNFLISEMYEKIKSTTKAALDSGYAGLSGVGMMSWSLESQVAPEILAQYEYDLDDACKSLSEFQALCLYSKEKFNAQDITLQCVCHQHILTPKAHIQNPLSDPEAISVNDFWASVTQWGAPIEKLYGKKAAFAKKVLENSRKILLKKFAQEDGSNQVHRLLEEIEDLTQKIERLSLTEKLSS